MVPSQSQRQLLFDTTVRWAVRIRLTPLLPRHTLNWFFFSFSKIAGDEYKIKMESEDGDSHYGAIIQLDGLPHTAEFSKSPFTFFKKPCVKVYFNISYPSPPNLFPSASSPPPSPPLSYALTLHTTTQYATPRATELNFQASFLFPSHTSTCVLVIFLISYNYEIINYYVF